MDLNPFIHTFPNPTDLLLNVKVDHNLVNNIIEIADLSGKIVFSQRVYKSEFIINTSNFVSGIYIIKVTHESGISSEKVVISH